MADEATRVSVEAGTELTAATAMHVRALVDDAVGQGRTIDLCLDSVSSYDAAGLGLLIALQRRVRVADGHLVCVNPSERLYAGIRKLGLHRVLDIRLDLPAPRAAAADGLVSGSPGPHRASHHGPGAR